MENTKEFVNDVENDDIEAEIVRAMKAERAVQEAARAEKAIRGNRRRRSYFKARRKMRIDHDVNDPEYPWYDNLNQYSKNKIHCSCPMCAFNNPHTKGVVCKSVTGLAVYRAITHSDKRKMDAQDAKMREYERGEWNEPEED